MKKANVIKPHSFVSLITNSSTELFVCNTKETLKVVNQILRRILKGYNIMNGAKNGEYTYTMKIFEKPYIFNLKKYRNWLKKERAARKKCKETKDFEALDKFYKSPFNSIKGWFHDDGNEEDLIQLRKDFISEGDRSGGWWSSDRNPFDERLRNVKDKDGKYNYEARRAEVEKIYKEIEALKNKPDWWIRPWLYHYNSTLITELDGCVILVGSDDNSIPYDIWEIINSQLNGRNYHLG